MLTYNQIIKICRNFQQAHHVLENFGNGGQWDEVLHNQQPTFKDPLMWMDDLPSSLSQGAETYSFRVSFSAKVVTLKERGTDQMSTNVNEVKSDMIQCANDFIAYWVNQTDNYPYLTLEKSVNRTTFEDLTEDKLTGCYIDVTFRQPFDYNKCSIPMGTPTSLPDTCAPVLIYEDGVLVDTVASGGTYSYTSGSSNPIDITVNGTIVFNQVTTDQVLDVLNTDDSPVGFQAGTDWYIDSSSISVNGVEVYLVPAEDSLNLGVKDSAGNLIGTPNYPDTVVDDCTQTMNGSAITAQLPETSKSFTIRRANNDPVTVTTITDTATSFVGEVPDVINTATPWKDGQTTSYVTGDAGANEDGAGTDFFTTNFTNDFGNTDRFTSENGGQTYTAGYIVDHAKKDQATGRIRVWKIGLESAAATTHLSGQPYTYGGLSGWKIPRIIDATEIFLTEQPTTALNYAPFNINANSIANSIILQNTLNATTGYRFANSLILSTATLANTMRRICYRDCTLAEINSL